MLTSILVPKVICALCFIMSLVSFFAALFMKAIWPERFANVNNQMTTQNASDLLLWSSIAFWFTMWCFRTMFSSW